MVVVVGVVVAVEGVLVIDAAGGGGASCGVPIAAQIGL